MRRALSRLSDEEFDLLIIGGGITGACVARDAAMRGLKAALIEKNDFAHATSAHNSKLVHGGLRYLRNFELGLVRESLRERRVWQRIAPHLVHPLPFLLPVHNDKSREILRAGLILYDLLSFDKSWLDDPDERLPNHSWLPRVEALAREPVIRKQELKGAFLYYDAQMYSPERLALECLIDADAYGAALANYVQAEKLLVRNGRIEGCTVRDVFSNATFDIRARVTLVAAGPWADLFLDRALNKESSTRLLRSKGIHLLTRALTQDHALTMTAGNGHFFVMPWRGHSLIGTTDTVFKGNPDDVGVASTDMGDFLSFVDKYLPAAQLGPRDVENFYAGIRPLVDDGSGDSYRVSRRAELIDHGKKDGAPGLFSAVGGKWTTSRALAETITNRIFAALGKTSPPCRTAIVQLPGGRIGRWNSFVQEVEAYPQLTSRRHLSRMYGRRLSDMMAQATAAGLQPMGPSGDIPAQIVFAARAEMAMTLADAVMRRTSLGQLGRPDEGVLQAAADIMAAELGWNEDRKAREIESLAPYFSFRETS
jgi:glycerol-3-phosphate dehydrogenase